MPQFYKLVSLLILLSSTVLFTEAQMRSVYVDPSQPYNEIQKISFYSPSQGYIATDRYIGYTTDSGRTITPKYITWSNVDYNGFNNVNFLGFGISGVKAFNEDTVIVYGDYGLVPAILFSTDKGNTFRLLYHTFYDPSKKTNGITDMVFPENKNTGYAIDADKILKTTNRGAAWTPVYSQLNSYFEFLEAVDDNTVFAFSVQNGNVLLKTINGGLSWQPVSLPAGHLKYTHFISANTGWAAMQDGAVYYTSNGGSTWSQKNNTAASPLYCKKIKFLNDNTGYALGYSYTIWKTSDSGKVWEPLPRENNFTFLNYTLNDLFFLTDQQFWAGGGSTYLELTTNGGGTPLPKAYFTIDTTNISATNEVRLINLSKPNYQYQWYRNDTLISTSYNASYIHNLYREQDTIKLIVTNGAYTDTAIQLQYFIVPAPVPVPVITTVTPTTGTAGTTITLSGLNFTGATAVSIGGIPAASFTVVSPITITAIVPEGGNGVITVTTSYGTAQKGGFTLIVPTQPVITSFSPAAAPVGSVLTITGKNFSSNPAGNIVYVGGVRATVLSAAPTALTVTVPTGAVYKPVSVTVGGLTGLSNLPFVVSLAKSETITSNSFPLRVDSVAENGALYIASVDLDGDGKPDMVTGNFSGLNRIEVFRNTSVVDTVSFGPRTYVTLAAGYTTDRQVTLADIDGDGKTDLLTSNDYPGTGFYVFKNGSTPGQINFAPKQGVAGTEISRLLVKDLNNDGLLDVIGIGNIINKVIVYQNTSSGNAISFREIGRLNMGAYPDHGYIEAADFDGDGKTDIITNNMYGQMQVYRNTSVGSLINFSFPVVVTLYADAYIFTAGDLDLDGKPDLAVAVPNEANATTDSLIILRNTSSPGSISFSQHRGLPALPYAVRKILINDLNGDGIPEITSISHYAVPKLHILESHSLPGSIVLGQPVEIKASKEIYWTGDLLDVDGDGKTDIVELNTKLSVFLNQTGTTAVRICAGSNTSFTSDLAGSTYQWQINTGDGFKNLANDATASGVATATLTITNIPQTWNNYLFRCMVDGHYITRFKSLVESSATPAATITIPDPELCAGSTASFVATAINGGDSPVWQWQINGQNTGNNSNQFSTTSLSSNDRVNVLLTSNSYCRPNETATSNTITVTVRPVVTPQVSVTADNVSICKGSNVTFTATPVNGGTNPVYSWNVSGTIISTGTSNTYTSNSLTSADVIYAQLTSSEKCASPAKVNSKDLRIAVKPVDPPSVTISASSPTAVCYGAIILFDAKAVNPGSGPTYQWQVNGNNVGTNSTSYVSNSLKKNDQVQLILTSNATCANTNTAVSNTLIMQDIKDQVVPTITISGNTVLNPGQSISLQAAINNGGTSPAYLWEDSTVQRGWAAVSPGTAATLTYIPPGTTGKIRCRLTSNANCANPVTVYSTPLVYTVNTPTAIQPVPADNYTLHMSPNPAHDWLTIDTLKLSDQWETIEIIDMNGQRALLQNIQYQTRVTVRTENLSQGMFTAVLRRKNGQAVYLKLVKM
jgi:photosystem II stability/assembly factor-like uncharacterized protein